MQRRKAGEADVSVGHQPEASDDPSKLKSFWHVHQENPLLLTILSLGDWGRRSGSVGVALAIESSLETCKRRH